MILEIKREDIKSYILSLSSPYDPLSFGQSNNGYQSKSFEIDYDLFNSYYNDSKKWMDELVKYTAHLSSSEGADVDDKGRELINGASIFNEVTNSLVSKKERSYRENKQCMYDNMHMLYCMGLYGFKVDRYIAIYDISELLPIAFSVYFNTRCKDIQSRLDLFFINKPVNEFQLSNAIGGRWDTLFDKVKLSDLQDISINFKTSSEYIASRMRINSCYVGPTPINLEKTPYSVEDVVNMSLEYHILKIEEYILTEIMKELIKIRDRGYSINIQTKGSNSVVFECDNAEVFDNITVIYEDCKIDVKPLVCKHSQIRENYLKFKTKLCRR